jgi:TolB-like protein/Tfp pilus assembly protein PilF
VPDLDDPQRLRAFFELIRDARVHGLLRAYHDRSDGGALATLCEMAFASHVGLDIDLDGWGEDRQGPAFRALCKALESKLGSQKKKSTAIAVLPFANLSADPENEYFSDGVTEEIINALSRIPGIQVASRTSSFAFKGRKDVDARQIGAKLGVSTLLEGSVRKVGNRIRISAQLVSVENGYQLWSETFDRQLEDIFAVQDEISRSIVDALKLRLVDDSAAVVAPTKSLDAYTTYLKGRFHFNKFSEAGLRKALDLFQNALLQDPGFARAYAGIADVWCDLADDWVAPDDAYPRAKAAAERALQRDAELADAMISIGKVLCWHEWNFAEGVRQVERAVSLSPNIAEAHWVLGTALPLVGRLQDGITAMRRALELDPLRVEYFGWATRLLIYSGDWDAAIKQGEETFEIDEKYGRGFVFIGSAYLAKGDAETALDWFRRGQSLDTAVRSYDAMIVRALAALGRREEAEEILARLESESRQHYVRAEYLAMGHAAVGHLDRAFEALERAYQARSAGLIYLHLDPGYGPLRGDPRYQELVRRIGLR